MRDRSLAFFDSRQERRAEILRDLGLCKVRVLSNNPAKIRPLEQCELEVVERVALEIQPQAAAQHYLRTKKEKMGTSLTWFEESYELQSVFSS